jgi:hypothetical protein
LSKSCCGIFVVLAALVVTAVVDRGAGVVQMISAQGLTPPAHFSVSWASGHASAATGLSLVGQRRVVRRLRLGIHPHASVFCKAR